MAVPTNTYASTAAVGNREDLTNIIDRITPSKTPFYSMIGKDSADGTKHEWQTQALRAAGENKHLEGDDTTATAVTPQQRLNNYTQIMKEAASVTGTQEKVIKAGSQGEMNKQIMLKSAELKLDIEYRLTRGSVAVTGATREMRGLLGFADSANISSGVGYVAPSYTANTAQTDGTLRTLTEAMLKDAWQKTYVSGGEPTVIMMGPVQKQIFSTFTGNAQREVQAQSAKLHGSIDVYVGDFGTLNAVVNLQQRSRDVWLLQPDKFKFSVLRPWQTSDLAKTGDSERKQILLEGTLTAINPKASGLIADIS